MVAEKLSFKVRGNFITNLAREWFFIEKRGYDKCIELLLSCMHGTNETKVELIINAEAILAGKAKFEGSTDDNTFCLVTGIEDYAFFEEYKEYIHKSYSLAEVIALYIHKEKLQELPEQNFYKFIVSSTYYRYNKENFKTSDYGWLAPDGTFFDVLWGQHEAWANRYVVEHFGIEHYGHSGTVQYGGTFLINRGWCLLHSPSLGNAIPTYDMIKGLTKAQKDFLYDYYIERGFSNKANSIFKED